MPATATLGGLTRQPGIRFPSCSLACSNQLAQTSSLNKSLESYSESGREAKIAALEIWRSGLEFVHLIAPTKQAHQPEIDAESQVFSERCFRRGSGNSIFVDTHRSDHRLPEGTESSCPGSPAQTEQKISLAHATVLPAEIGNRSKIAKVHFLGRCVPAAEVRACARNRITGCRRAEGGHFTMRHACVNI